jgi:hypothetical protein
MRLLNSLKLNSLKLNSLKLNSLLLIVISYLLAQQMCCCLLAGEAPCFPMRVARKMALLVLRNVPHSLYQARPFWV